MELIVLLFAVTLLHSEGSSAVTPVFVKKGGDVLLEVINADGLKDFLFIEWNFKKTAILVRFAHGRDPVVSLNYTGRLKFPVKNYSVNLKNLQHIDSGVYTARVSRLEGDQTLAEYKVTVQDPVSPVDLTVDSVFNSSNPCNVTVTCRTQDFYINSTFTCDTKTCSQEGGEQSKVTTSGASLQVYLDLNDSIICNHSNQVSRTEDIKMIEKFCLKHDDPEQHSNNATVPVVVIVVLVIILLPIAVVLFLYYRKRRKDCSYSPSTRSETNT
ncbi:uncharacterized protein LOC117272155 isoform X2 [Epinephelus lanceolatus]